jgi:SNF2 family N-terminal domain.
MWAIYEETFLSNVQIDGNVLEKLSEEVEVLPMNAAFQDDMGIPDDLKVLNLLDLQTVLGCTTEGTFPGFNSHRSLCGQDPWEGANESESAPLRLRWHQLIGVMVLVRLLTSAQKPVSPAQGVLIADEVGLGKSAQFMAFLSVLLHAAKADERQATRPPALGTPV